MVASLEGPRRGHQPGAGDRALAAALGLPVGARGVESLAQANALRDAGCAFGQGSVFSEALDAEAAEALLAGARSWRSPVSRRAG